MKNKNSRFLEDFSFLFVIVSKNILHGALLLIYFTFLLKAILNFTSVFKLSRCDTTEFFYLMYFLAVSDIVILYIDMPYFKFFML